MTSSSTNDRRQLAQDKIADMANLPGCEHPVAVRQIAAGVLGCTPVSDAIIAVDSPQLPSTATVVGTLSNEFGPDYAAVHFDLSGHGTARSYVSNARIQAANRVVQQYAGGERYPLLIFTLPDSSGVQFVTGNPAPSNRDRLLDVIRVTAYWGSLNRTTLDCLERVGNGIVNGEPPQRAFRNGFSVQPITDEFFRDYKAAYDHAVALLSAGIDRADAEQFAQTLYNRLLFIHFVSKKGWLSFEGNHDYLNALWRDYKSSPGETNFFRNRLRCLFFDGLNNPDGRDLTSGLSPLIGDVPFLNGGLFEPTDLDARAANSEFTVPDEIVEPVLTDLFNAYNFTVMESTPLDTEVAVDPEMLGKLFEETVNERHSNGAYYTPRPVVAFMCREAVKGYLGGKGIAGLDDAKIADLVDNRNPQAVTPQQALEIANAVAEMKTVDPACGSGAFLLGMLQEILALNDSLFAARNTSESLYRQKLDIISNTIYGADKDGLAVSTAMLRLWLSLAVDYDGEDAPDPLPNLDLKLVVGDSIAGPDPRSWDFTHQWIQDSTLHQDIVAYTTEPGQRKLDLKRRVEGTKQTLRENMQDAASAGDVEWRIDFADVMSGGGFDIVIGNPPYVQLQRNGGELANLYRSVGYTTFVPRGDIYQLFYERGCQLLKPDHGLLAYITSNSWLKAEYGKTTRRYFSEQHTPTLLMEMGKDVFEEAIVDTSVLLLRQGNRGNRADLSIPAIDIDRRDGTDFPPPAEQWGLTRPDGDAPWSILSATEDSVMDKMRTEGMPLRGWDVTIYRGVTTGLNDAFIIDEETRAKLVASDPKSAEIIKPVLRGRDIQRYQAKWANLWLIIAKFGSYQTLPKEYPAVYDHLLQHEQRLRARGQCKYTRTKRTNANADYDGQHHWLELDNNPTDVYLGNFGKEKLFWMDMSPEGRFAYSNEETYCNNKGFFMTGGPLKYLCAVLNSSLITWMMKNTARTTGMGLLQWEKFAVERLPVPKVDAGQQRPFVRLVDRILAAKAADPAADTADLEAEIDRLVHDLYGLTEEERTAIERSLGLIHASDERTEGKPAFKVVPNTGGFAPGVDPSNIKEIIRDLEDEELLEKLGP